MKPRFNPSTSLTGVGSPTPAPGEVGSERNMFTGPGFFQFDLGLFKNFGLGDRRRLELRMEVFNLFDLRDLTVYKPIAVAGTAFAQNPSAVSLGTIWTYLAIAFAYGLAYVTFALSAGLWSFRTRELGGAEG